MAAVITACLEFCIKLLNQKIKVYKYESPLICAMAVLGQGEVTWQGPESYPPIISQVLKVARFILVQKYIEIIRMWAAAAEQGSWTGDAADKELGFIINKGNLWSVASTGPFLQDARTWWPEPAMARTFTTQGEVNSPKIQKYFQQVAQFKEKLAVAHVNTKTNQRQNIYIKDGMMVFITTYHKGFHTSNNIKIIH
ncbi:hypothetical protein P175DRAFT_0510356 [Aspergillus ochraceoroseus IBT 24754]|uniref:Uncharacterized protein n=1 Tax=Aspergillus ochraceoroseus IBT 24754 TaxID=1392256 RepID=A0A2T5LS00_9EURO|nr:uncharacterized protein P175DRAFT_0510356 [Aspergillus ochraceoroseus IBT 24754]PTU19051.1 hypothetical protein P175DRAFT_0510356 [Aspergillus ochraceoroseus IBT 24754]